MIYTVGYGRMESPDVLVRLARKLRADVVDVRGSRGRAKPGFGCRQLESFLPTKGIGYVWHGDLLGGRTLSQKGINRLVNLDEQSERSQLLLCSEEAPGECHRHKIALKCGEALHVYRNEVIDAHDLEEAIKHDVDYPCETLTSHVRWLKAGCPE